MLCEGVSHQTLRKTRVGDTWCEKKDFVHPRDDYAWNSLDQRCEARYCRRVALMNL